MDDFERLLEDAKEQYNKVIIINEDNAQKYKEYCKKKKIPIYNLSLKLAELLKDVPQRDRDQEANDKLKSWLTQVHEEVVGCDNIDYLFSQEVGKINPIITFNYATRKKNKVVVLFVKARRRNNLLIYSEEGSPDYMEMDISSNEGFVLGW